MILERLRDALGSRIRDLRIAKGWTQSMFAMEIDVDPAYISSIESSKKLPSVKILAKIAESFGIEFYELFIDEEDFKKIKFKNRKIFEILKDSSPERIDTIYKITKALHAK